MLSHRPTSLSLDEGQGSAACQAPPPPPHSLRPPSFTSQADPASSAPLPTSSLGVPAPLPGQSSPSPASAPASTSTSTSTSTSKDDLPLRVRDAIVAAQWSPANTDPRAPLGLSAAALLAAGVCDARRDADAVVRALARAGVLAPRTHEPVTAQIGPRLTHQVRVLSVPAVKALVRVLFFCEEEAVRLRRYEGEQADLEVALGQLGAEKERLEKGAVSGGGGGGDAAQDEDEELKEERERLDKMMAEVQFRIKAIELRKKVQPSKREAEIDLPRYEPAASL